MGVAIPPLGPDVFIDGVGATGLRDPDVDLDCANSGTSVRLLAGVVAGAGRTARFVGDASLSKRPMRRIAIPLEQMGATITCENGDGLPMRVGGATLRAIEWTSPAASAQVKSAILLAALCARVSATIREPSRSRDHTERMLAAMGAPVSVSGTTVSLDAYDGALDPLDFAVPGDPSSAAFFAAWGLLAGRPIRTSLVSLNPTRTGFYSVLTRAGASVEFENVDTRCGEPVGRITIAGTLDRPITLDANDVPTLIDELPLVACLAAHAPGETRITGAEELRVKESDRIAAVVRNLRTLGAHAEELPDGFVIRGSRTPLRGTVKTHRDHRIAMAFGILGALPGNEITVDHPECVGVSFPGFWTMLDTAVSA